MQSGNLGIQAKGKPNNTKTNKKEPCHHGGKQIKRGERPEHNTHINTSHTEGERRGARRQQRTE